MKFAVKIGIELAQHLDQPLVLLCVAAQDEATPLSDDAILKTRVPYVDTVRQSLADQSKSIDGLVADVIEVPNRIKEIEDWLLSAHSSESLGRFAIHEVVIPRMQHAEDQHRKQVKDAIFSDAPCTTINVFIEPRIGVSEFRFDRIGYLVSNRKETRVAKRFAKRLVPEQLISLTRDTLDPQLDAIIFAVEGPAAAKKLETNKSWRALRADRFETLLVAINPAHSLLQRISTFLDEQLREIFSDYQMARESREHLAQDLRDGTRASPEFILFMLVATSLACIGLIQDSAAVIIGAMLVAPMMTPLLGASLAMIQGNLPLMKSAAFAVLTGVALSFLIGIGVGAIVILAPARLFIDSPMMLTNEMIARSHSNLLDPLIGLAGGLAGGFALGRDKRVGALAGVAIAAALVPPIATAGLETAIVTLAAWRLESLDAIGELLLHDPHRLLTKAELLPSNHKSVENCHLIVAPLILFLMNACTVVIGASVGLRIVGMHRTKFPKRSKRWVVAATVILLLASLALLSIALIHG